MTIEEPASGGIVHALTPRKRKRRGTTMLLTGAGVVALAAFAGWYYLQHRANPDGERPWILPPGLASMSEALVCQRDGDIPCAEADLVAYTKKYPNDSHAFALLAIILTQDGRHKEALYYYQQAEKMGVATYDLDAGYAKSLDATGHIDAAMAKNRAALGIYPTLVDVRGAFADELMRKGRGKEAVDLLESFAANWRRRASPPISPPR
jgi:tetratricopeptide (TPR) repeat protein